jgi:dTDP-4-amino-4,6-dideoxygalactose transaminase
MIPFLDLKRQYLSIQSEIDSAIKDVISRSAYIGGSCVSDFENEFSIWLGIKHCIGCANGTDSLEILLKAMGIGLNDEVIVPAISWISTSEAVSAVGATPVFVDIDPDSYTIDVSKIEQSISKNTKAIIPVHLYGHPADMPKIMTIAKKHNLQVIEDCAQAHGAMIDGKMAGTFGDAASFSFYPGKNLGAYGDAGAMVTNNDTIAKLARRIANHGQEGKHNHLIEGRNSRLDGLQAAILRVKLKHLDGWVNQRNSIANEYLSRINSSFLGLPKKDSRSKHAWHLFVIRSLNRSDLMEYLKMNGVEVAIHYPTALPFLACYSSRKFKASDFPVAYAYQDQILSIPIFPEITMDELNIVISLLNEFKH